MMLPMPSLCAWDLMGCGSLWAPSGWLEAAGPWRVGLGGLRFRGAVKQRAVCLTERRFAELLEKKFCAKGR